MSVTNLEMVNNSEQKLVSRLSGPPEYEYNLATTTADFQMENEIDLFVLSAHECVQRTHMVSS